MFWQFIQNYAHPLYVQVFYPQYLYAYTAQHCCRVIWDSFQMSQIYQQQLQTSGTSEVVLGTVYAHHYYRAMPSQSLGPIWNYITIPSPICPTISQVLPDLICGYQHSQIQGVICHRTTLDIPSCPWHGLFLFNLLRSKMSHLSQDTPACPRNQHSNMSHLFQDSLKYSHEVNRLY